MATTFNPYDDDPFGINTTTTTTSSTTNNPYDAPSSSKVRAFTSSPHQQQQYNNLAYFQSANLTPILNIGATNTNHNNNNTLTSPNKSVVTVSPTITSTPTYQTTPRRSTIGFEDDFSTTPDAHGNGGGGMIDTSFTIESSDVLLSMGATPSHRHTLSGASTNTINTTSMGNNNNNNNGTTIIHNNSMIMSNNNNTMNHQYNHSMSSLINSNNYSGYQQQHHQQQPYGSGVNGTTTSPNYTPRQSVVTPRESISEDYNTFNTTNLFNTSNVNANNNGNVNGMLPNATLNSIKSNETQANNSVKRRSRTMFESSTSNSSRSNNYSKDLLDFNPFSNQSTDNTTTNTTTTTNSNNSNINNNTKKNNSVMDNINLQELKNSLPDLDELSGEGGSPISSNRPKSMKFLKSTLHHDANTSLHPNNSLNHTTNEPTSPGTLSGGATTRESLLIGSDQKLSIPECILMIALSDSGIVKSYVSDQIEEICMMGIFCELILHKKITTRPLRDLQGKFGLQVLDHKPIPITNKRDSALIELLNEVLTLLNGINEKCLAKDVNQMTVKDYVKILCSGKKVGNVLIYKIANILTRIGKQLSERKIVDYKKTLFLFLSLPIKDKIERDRCLNELVLFLKMLRSELDSNSLNGIQDESLIVLGGTLTYDTCTERMLKNRHDFVIYSLLGIFTMNNTDILSNDIIKNENDRKSLKELSFSIFNIHHYNNTRQHYNKDGKRRPSLIDDAMTDYTDEDEDNMLSINSTGGGGGDGGMVYSSSTLSLDKKTNINLHHFPEGLNYFEEIALQLKRCIYGGNKQ